MKTCHSGSDLIHRVIVKCKHRKKGQGQSMKTNECRERAWLVHGQWRIMEVSDEAGVVP